MAYTDINTFVYDGPIFRRPIALTKGDVVHRDGFFFCDPLPATPSDAIPTRRARL
ncbi:MAG: hypothetical protein HY737_01270 [Candidatus Omnitrophica bacterium]|nr:hypothetical protein [Candidatus Omnitrophota bacterium]